MVGGWQKLVPLEDCRDLFPHFGQRLAAINQALRHINLGKMDFLPYEEEVPGYQLTMRSVLIPQGVGRPPGMGKWQIEVIREGVEYQLILQGKVKAGQELGEVAFPCGDGAERARVLGLTDIDE
ncbi:hypothetical protein [Sulfobacillus harzensis]|uniref:hypothetical protein n=1 Tax=Sulfobacillus harzensis TaxID=2729629 RepID=UPI001A9B2FB9|nr:hypothetical protein [Sulfobacillus harzensis]